MSRVVLAIDSFKGCISSSQICDVISVFFARRYPQAALCSTPIADGGEGLVEALAQRECETVELTVADPLMRPVAVRYIIADRGTTAILELASAAGLPLVEEPLRNPLKTTTYGVGQIIADALARGCRRFIMGIGGSATNDAATGMLSALGFRFLDSDGNQLEGTGENLEKIASIDASQVNEALRDARFEVASDVNNPLYGTNGAAYVYAPQKGADKAMVERLDAGLRNFAQAVERFNGRHIGQLQGAGAAGGVGAGVVAMLDAHLRSGIDIVLDYIGFDAMLDGAALVITGEGRMDRQTVMGKAPFGVMKRAKAAGVPVIALAGRIDDPETLLAAGFDELCEISPRDMPLREAMQRDVTERNITAALERLDLDKYFI